jgi:8-oxo-dGTP diphosphatase
MLYRSFPPNQFHWNGVGGKIEPGETPLECVIRETAEETDIDLTAGKEPTYAGIVTWPAFDELSIPAGGMHVFLTTIESSSLVWFGDREAHEGTLAWKPIDWVCDRSNPAVVSNIPYFLPEMMVASTPKLYRCMYSENTFTGLTIEPLNCEA